MRKQLTPRQQRFIAEYLIDLNATQAAIRAGYSKKTARIIANENLTKPDIAAAIQSEMKKRSERTRVTSDEVIRETAKVAFFNIDYILGQDGTVLMLKEWPKAARAAIKSIDFHTGEDGITQIRRISFWDKMKAIELLGKHLKTWDQAQESNERDLIGSLLKSLEPTIGPPSLRPSAKGSLIDDDGEREPGGLSGRTEGAVSGSDRAGTDSGATADGTG